MATDKEISYKNQLKRLFPLGRLWNTPPGEIFERLLEGVAVEFARIDARALDLIEEADPRTTVELIEEWKAMVGFPGPCGSNAETLDEIRRQIVAQITLTGPQSREFYANIGRALGYDLEPEDITDFCPFVAGSPAGSPLSNHEDWPHTFMVSVSEFTERPFRAGSHGAGDRLVEFGDTLLECLINEQKQAHTIALFTYG